MAKTTVFVVRHGQTQSNATRRLMGTSNNPLNETGRLQAELLGKYFENAPVDMIYVSPLRRARQTADAIAQKHPKVKVKILENLHERAFGEAEGLVYEEANKKYPQITFAHTWHYPDFKPKGGESLTEVRNRAKKV